MREILYREIPTPDSIAVCQWLQSDWQPANGVKTNTPNGVRLRLSEAIELSIFVWTLQRTTYLKVFRWGQRSHDQETSLTRQLDRALQKRFPPQFSTIPNIDQKITQFLQI